MEMNYEYNSLEDAQKAVDLAIEDTIKDNPQYTEDEIAWDMVQAIAFSCEPSVARELCRINGVDVPMDFDDPKPWKHN